MLKRSATSRSTRLPVVASTAAHTSETRSPPHDPVAPGEGIPKPTDVLIARLSELKRLAKSLAQYYATLQHGHQTHGETLSKLAQGETLRLPWLEQSLFLPPTGAPAGEGGWAELVGQLKTGTDQEAGEHLELARLTSTEVVEPLKQLRVTIKSFIADLEKHVNPLLQEVTKSREQSFGKIQALTTAVGAYTNSPLSISAEQDPLVLRAGTEAQMREQVVKENELLAVVKQWQNKTKAFEFETFGKIAQAVSTWETESLKRFDTTRAHARDISARLDRANPEIEWNHFVSLNYLLPEDVPTRNPDAVDFPEKDHASTRPIKQGILERKKRVVKSWKEAYFVLSAAGFLHEYPDSTTSLASPSVSLFLPNCVVTQLTTPDGKDRHATFTISGRQSTNSGTMRGAFGMQHSDMSRSYRARSHAEALEWWTEIAKHSKTPPEPEQLSAEERQGPAPTAVQRAGLPSEDAEVAPAMAVGAGAVGPAAVATGSGAVMASIPEQASSSLSAASRDAAAPVVDTSATSHGPGIQPTAPIVHDYAAHEAMASRTPNAVEPASFMRLNEPATVHSPAIPSSVQQTPPPLLSAPSYATTAPVHTHEVKLDVNSHRGTVPAPVISQTMSETASAIPPSTGASVAPEAVSTQPATSAIPPPPRRAVVVESSPVMVDSHAKTDQHAEKEAKLPGWLKFGKKKRG